MNNKYKEILEALCSRDRTNVLVVCGDPERSVLGDFISEVGFTGAGFKVIKEVNKIENPDTGTRVYFLKYRPKMVDAVRGCHFQSIILLTNPTDYDKEVLHSRIRPDPLWQSNPHWFSEYRDTWLEKASD